jgi:hypothetical protein
MPEAHNGRIHAEMTGSIVEKASPTIHDLYQQKSKVLSGIQDRHYRYMQSTAAVSTFK